VDGVAGTIGTVNDSDAMTPRVARESEKVDGEREGGARSARYIGRAPLTKAGRKMHRPQPQIRDPLKSGQRGRQGRALPARTSEVHHEALAIQVAHHVTVDRRVRSEAVLGVEEQDVDLLAHFSLVRREPAT
jgi:hypothetical protein